MPAFKEMDPGEVVAAIEGFDDELSSEAMALDAFYNSFRCPRCKLPLQKEFDPRHAFDDPTVMNPRALLRCTECRYLMDPHSNLVVEYGDASKVPYEPFPTVGE
jgi:hypothetical protein